MNTRSTNHARAGLGLGLAALLLFAFASAALASGPPRVSVAATASQNLSVPVGKSIIVESADAVRRLSVAQPEIADTVILTPRQIYVTGKAAGVTTLTLWGEGNRITAAFDVEVVPDVAALKEKIHQMFPNEEGVKAVATHDSITLSGTVSGAGNLAQITKLAEAYAPVDKVTGKPKVLSLLEVGGVQQVMLEVRVSEMSRTLMRRLGVNLTASFSNRGNTFGLSFLKDAAALPHGVISGLFHTGDVNWTVLIDALKENGLTKVLAEPTLITLSGRSASFLAGGEFPIPVPQTGTGAGTTITIEYKTFGVGLNFTPTVLGNGKISMMVNPEVSDLDFSRGVSLQGYIIPSVNTRRVSTVIELADGQSFAVAGLLKDDLREVVSKFPVLGDIPILGALFRSSEYQKNETELVIIVTPHLVKPVDMAKQTLPTDAFIEPDDFEFYLLGSMEGRDRGDGGRAAAPGPAVPGLKRQGGLEGDFGHMKP